MGRLAQEMEMSRVSDGVRLQMVCGNCLKITWGMHSERCEGRCHSALTYRVEVSDF